MLWPDNGGNVESREITNRRAALTGGRMYTTARDLAPRTKSPGTRTRRPWVDLFSATVPGHLVGRVPRARTRLR